MSSALHVEDGVTDSSCLAETTALAQVTKLSRILHDSKAFRGCNKALQSPLTSETASSLYSDPHVAEMFGERSQRKL